MSLILTYQDGDGISSDHLALRHWKTLFLKAVSFSFAENCMNSKFDQLQLIAISMLPNPFIVEKRGRKRKFCFFS